MTPEQFTYWLQGFVELGKGTAPTAEQWKSIQEHLSTVFKKVTPHVGDYVASETDMQRQMREAIEQWNKAERQIGHQQTPVWPAKGHGYTITC